MHVNLGSMPQFIKLCFYFLINLSEVKMGRNVKNILYVNYHITIQVLQYKRKW